MADFGFGNPDPFSTDLPGSSLGGTVQKPRPEWRKPLPAPQAESFTKQLTNRGLSGLQYVLSSLDKPGRAVRGVLGGRPHEALAAIPFSDSLGLTDPEQAVSGRDLLNNAGVTTRNDKGWGAWGAGLATDIALDPLTYAMGPGRAWTKLGRVAKDAGATRGMGFSQLQKGFTHSAQDIAAAGGNATRIADQGGRIASKEVTDLAAKRGIQKVTNEPLRALAGIGLPWQDPFVTFGKNTPKLAAGLDKAAAYLKRGNAVGRIGNMAFNPSVGESRTATGQRAWSEHAAPVAEKMKGLTARERYDLIHGVNQGVASGVDERKLLAAAVEHAEGVPLQHAAPETYAAAKPIADQVRMIQEGRLGEGQDIGLRLFDLNDQYAKHVPRSAVSVGQHAKGMKPDTLYQTVSSNQRHRKDWLRGIPGGTEAYNRWVDQYAGMPAKQLDPIITRDIASTLGRMQKTLNPDEVLAMQDHVKGLASHISALDPAEYRSSYLPPGSGHLDEPSVGYGGYFNPDLVGNMASYAAKHDKNMTAAHGLMGMIHQNVKPISQLADPVNLLDMQHALKMYTWHANPKIAGSEIRGFLPSAIRKSAIAGAPDIEGMLAGKLKPMRKLAKQYGVERSVFDAMTQDYNKWAAPATAQEALKFIDPFTSAFKNMAYSMWIPSHVRNLMSGTSSNLQEGIGAGSHMTAGKVLRDTATAAEIARVRPDLPAGLSDEAARHWIKREAYADAGIGSGIQGSHDLPGMFAKLTQGDRITPELPLSGSRGPTGSLVGDIANLGKEGLLGAKGPGGEEIATPFWRGITKQAGVAGNTTDKWGPLHAGRLAGKNLEEYMRMASYLGETNKGALGTEAGRRANRIHFDYGNATQFERNVMKRLVPFYTFTRKNLPLQLDRLVNRPGSVSAQLRPFVNIDQNQYTPEHLASGFAVPVGQEKDGQQQYVSQSGLPIEEAFERMKFKNNLPDIPATAMAYMAGMNPLLKGPLEQIFDKQFFSGRNLSDLQPSTAGSLGGVLGDEVANPLTQAISNTPFTRMATSLDKLTDSRKSIPQKMVNLLTGVRVTDVDVNKLKAIEARKALEEMLRGSNNLSSYTNFYVRPENQANLTPEETQQMQMLSLLQANARAYAEQKRQDAAAGPHL